MRRERCPRCGGPLGIEGETWTRGSGRIVRSSVCPSCGDAFETHLPWGAAAPPSELGRGRTRGLFAGLLALTIVLGAAWLLLRSLDYVDRVNVYGAVSTAAERFLHPGWFVGLAVAAALLLALMRGRRTIAPVRAAMAPEVQLRAEPPGKLSVVVSGDRNALASDLVVERRRDEERRIVEEFDELARRHAAFDHGGTGEGGWSRAEIEEAQRQIYALGLAIGRGLLGDSGDAADVLVDLPGDHLQLSIQPELARVPWELMVARAGGVYLWQLFSVARQIRDVEPPRMRPRERSGPARMLLIANPEAGVPGRELPAAEDEARELMDLAARRPDVLTVSRKSPRTMQELERVLSGGFDIVHFAGHTGSGERSGDWMLSEGEAVNPSEVLSAGTGVPSLVFANACRSNPPSDGATGVDAARAMLRLGVSSYVCALSELHDRGSAAFSLAFYRAALSGATLAGALNRARQTLMGSYPVTWANYVLYGDPAARLNRLTGTAGGAKKASS